MRRRICDEVFPGEEDDVGPLFEFRERRFVALAFGALGDFVGGAVVAIGDYDALGWVEEVAIFAVRGLRMLR